MTNLISIAKAAELGIQRVRHSIWADPMDHAQFVGDVLLGNRSPGKRIASVFGFEPVTMYRKNTPK